jgi:hypothetical protein
LELEFEPFEGAVEPLNTGVYSAQELLFDSHFYIYFTSNALFRAQI